MGKIAILSGRYEILHAGHIKTIIREAKKYDKLYVYVVDNPKSPTPNLWVIELMNMLIPDNVTIVLDKCHFAFATKEDIKKLPYHDVFLSANPIVTLNLKSLNVNVKSIYPTGQYSCTHIKTRILEQLMDKLI